MLKNITYIVTLLIGTGCSTTLSEPYLYKGFDFEELALDCSENKARDLATEYTLKKYPELIGRISNESWKNFSVVVGDSIITSEFKAILEYKTIKSEQWHRKYYEESVSVSIDKTCELFTVTYFKGEQTATF